MVRNGIYDEIMMGSEIINAELIAVFVNGWRCPKCQRRLDNACQRVDNACRMHAYANYGLITQNKNDNNDV